MPKLPQLSSFSLEDILPFSYVRSPKGFPDEQPVIKVILGNGKGKTTVCDLIELSFFRKNALKRSESFQSRLHKQNKGTPKGFIVTSWNFGEREATMRQQLTPGQIVSYINDEHIKEKDYSNNLIALANYDDKRLLDFFEDLYYIREDDTFSKLMTDDGMSRILDNLKILASQDDVISKKTVLEKKKSSLRSEINEEGMKIAKIHNKIESTHDLPDTSLDILMKKIEKHKKKVIRFEEIINRLKREKKELNRNFRKYYKDLRTVSISLSNSKREKSQNNRQLNNITKEIEDLEKRNFETFLEDQKNHLIDTSSGLCPVCSRNIIQSWGQRLKENCPYCGLMWSNQLIQIDSQKREELLKQKNKKRDILIENLLEITRSLDKYSKEEKSVNNSIERVSGKIDEKEEEIELQQKKLNNIIIELSEDQGTYDGILNREKLPDKLNKSKTKLKSLEQNLDQINEEIESLSKLSDNYYGEFISSITKNFEVLIERFLGILASVTLTQRSFFSNEQNTLFEAISISQKFIIDLLFRIAIWNSVVEFRFTKRPTLIIDYTDHLDEENINVFIGIMQYLREKKFIIVLTCKPGSLVDKKIEGAKVEFKRQTLLIQTTLGFFFPTIQVSEETKENTNELSED